MLTCLSCDEIKKVENMWIVYVQNHCFKDVIVSIEENKFNNLRSQLGLYIDNSGIIRCRGRLQNAELSKSAKVPILLPKNRKLNNNSKCPSKKHALWSVTNNEFSADEIVDFPWSGINEKSVTEVYSL